MTRNSATSQKRGHHATVTSARLEAQSTLLGLRLLLPLILVAATVLAIHAFFSFRSTKDQFLRFANAEVGQVSDFIRHATRDGMLLNRMDDVQTTIEQLARQPSIAAIRIYDQQGNAVVSSESPARTRTAGRSLVSKVTPLANEPACARSGCHDVNNAPVLGTLEVEMSAVPLTRALAATRMRLVWTTLALMAVFAVAVTLILRAQHDWLRVSQTLEDMVAQRTAQLQAAQRQVLHMEKMASLGKLSATVAHELNNPISGMLTYARLIERELADQPLASSVKDELDTWLHLVQQECSRCGEIVSNLLVFARRNSSAMTPIKVNDVVQRSVMLIHHRLDINGIRATVRYINGSDEIIADPGQLEQALVALLINAAEAMPHGGRLSVELEGDHDGVTITLKDTGTGIPADVLQQIFEPFFTTKHNESGAGLGLAVVYGIVHRHGGEIEVESTVGVGTTFHLRFPRQPPADDAAVEPQVTAADGVLV